MMKEVRYVVDEAVIVCSNTVVENCLNNLMVDSQDKLYMHKRLVATKADNKELINIRPFKCSCKFGKCRPKFENFWKNHVENITISGNEPLIEKSILECTRYSQKGIISIIDTGQRVVDEIKEISDTLKKMAQQSGKKLDIRIQMSEYLTEKYGKSIEEIFIMTRKLIGK